MVYPLWPCDVRNGRVFNKALFIGVFSGLYKQQNRRGMNGKDQNI